MPTVKAENLDTATMAEYRIEKLAEPEDADLEKVQVLIPPGEESINYSSSILFVHGLFGSRKTTWTKNGVLWPQSLLSTDVPNARIMTFGYDADITKLDSSQVTNGTMESHAADLCVALARERADTNSVERPIILVAHSLGGLVCAQALIAGERADLDYDMAVVSRHIGGMVFLGTPFRGSHLAKWAEMLRKIANAFHETQSKKLKDLETKSEKLKILAESFPEVISKRRSEGSKIGVMFCYETLKMQLGTLRKDLIVEEDAAWIPGAGDHVKIDANHIEMCKFDAKEDEGYKTVVGAIKKFANLKKSEDRSHHGGATFHNYERVYGQIGGDMNITGSSLRWG